jgi:hypothetical protein
MTEQNIYDDLLGKLENRPDTDSWEGEWKVNGDLIVDVMVCAETDIKTELKTAKDFLLKFIEKEPQTREHLSKSLIKLCNEDWNSEKPLTEKEFAERISLQSISIYFKDEVADAEVFYNDDDIFGGHSISFFMKSSGEISEPNLAG